MRSIGAFGALNQDSYEMLTAHVLRLAKAHGFEVKVVAAGPYPNAEAKSEAGRPLRAEALQDDAKKQELFKAVAGDAVASGAAACDILCMPCMSMVGFHDGIEAALGKKIVRLADAIAEKYKDADKVGVIHMRPAKKRIEEIFGSRAITPDEEQSARLLSAEEEVKKSGSSKAVEDVMKDIVESWRDDGIKKILFARADAPKAENGPAGKVSGVVIDSYFSILAENIVSHLKS